MIEPAQQIEAFMRELPPKAKTALDSLMERRRLPKGAQLFKELPDSLIFLYSGEIAFYSENHELARHGPGTMLGLRSVLENRPSTIRAVSEEPSEIGAIPAEDFKYFLERFPAGYMAIARILGCELQSIYAMLRQEL